MAWGHEYTLWHAGLTSAMSTSPEHDNLSGPRRKERVWGRSERIRGRQHREKGTICEMKLNMKLSVWHSCNPSIWGAETGWSWVQNQPELYIKVSLSYLVSKTLLWKLKKKERWEKRNMKRVKTHQTFTKQLLCVITAVLASGAPSRNQANEFRIFIMSGLEMGYH